LIPAHGEVYSIQHYVMKLVSGFRENHAKVNRKHMKTQYREHKSE